MITLTTISHVIIRSLISIDYNEHVIDLTKGDLP